MTGRDQDQPHLEDLFAAIVADERQAVGALLAAEPKLSSGQFQASRLYDSAIFHWMYAGDTALHLAAAGHRTDIVRKLLAAGADVDSAYSRRKSTPLHYAADGYVTGPAWNAEQQMLTLRVLLNAGADIRRPDANGATALHRAVRTRCAGAVSLLLDAGSDATAPNHAGSTPFHLAVQTTGRGGSGEPVAHGAQRQIIQLFLSRGISPQHRNSNGKTVLESAGSGWVRALLLSVNKAARLTGGIETSAAPPR